MFVLGYDDLYLITTVSEKPPSQGTTEATLKSIVKKPNKFTKKTAAVCCFFERGIEFDNTKYVESCFKIVFG